MLLVRKPDTPNGFTDATRAAGDRITQIVEAGNRPTSKKFNDKWSDFKHVLAEAQHGRCGYCDRKVLGGDDGTVDHFRPKTEVETLDDNPITWGLQKPYSAGITGRSTEVFSALGYHWLAYAWSNYVFACSCCNEKWKRAIFPVATHPRCCPPRQNGCEEPLLMNCYRLLQPSDHLQFNGDGTVEARNGSTYGLETIRTLGLYREPLRDERADVARDVYELLREFATGGSTQQQDAIRDLCRIANENRPFAGVARAIVEQQLGMQWEQFSASFAST